jgi:hypothetical protein
VTLTATESEKTSIVAYESDAFARIARLGAEITSFDPVNNKRFENLYQ